MKIRNRLLAAFCFVLLSFSLLIASIRLVAFDLRFYQNEYTKLNVAEEIDISKADLLKATEALLDYIRTKRDDIVVTANIEGYDREVFDERETAHMVDVRDLFVKSEGWMKIGFLLSLIGIALVLVVFKDREAVWFGYRFGICFVFGLILLLAGFAIVDFYDFWMNFHYLFFTNDLFLLDPNVSVMINMFPQRFFFDMVIRIICVTIFAMLTLGILAYRIGGKKYVTRRFV